MVQDNVILLHGLSRSSTSMKRIEKTLKKQGYYTINIDYPSRKNSIENLAKPAIQTALMECKNTNPLGQIHFVTHSMGGILLRYYLSEHTIEQLGRVVMIAPPNKGCHLVDVYRRFGFLKMACGKSVMQLGTDKNSIPMQLKAVNYPTGIIAGRARWHLFPINIFFLKEPSDGVVTIENTKVEGMQDFIEINATHSLIVFSKKAIQQVSYFLQHGCFQQ